MGFRFYLGTHRPQWLATSAVALFVSARRLIEIKRRLPRAVAPWALDSGGFSELHIHGKWTVSPVAYVAAVRRYAAEIGRLDWAAIQDWMCERTILRKTGLTVARHQARTIDSYEALLDLAPELPWLPVLQGSSADDYLWHRDSYLRRGHDLLKVPAVGIGSVCRRQRCDEVAVLLARLAREGYRLHAFGFKATGLRRSQNDLVSSDSMAWSFHARRNPGHLVPHSHMNCANCLTYALLWRERLLGSLCDGAVPMQLPLPVAGVTSGR